MNLYSSVSQNQNLKLSVFTFDLRRNQLLSEIILIRTIFLQNKRSTLIYIPGN